MHKTIQIAAIALLVLLTALAAVTVQLYRQSRDQNRLIEAQGVTQLAAEDSFRNAADALQRLQFHTANYLLTGEAASLEAYRESLQDWQYEAGTLNLLSRDDARAEIARFPETGNQLAAEMAVILDLYAAGSREAALARLRTGVALAYLDKIKEANRKAFGWARDSFTANRLNASRRLIYCAGGLYLLGFLGLALLLYLNRVTAASAAEGRAGPVSTSASN